MGAFTGADDAESGIEAPEDADLLYLLRGSEADAFRPLSTGDVFRGSIPWARVDHEFFVISSHPCSMRQGSVLRPTVQVMPVTEWGSVNRNSWLGNFRLMPLPDLFSDGRPFAASFDLGAPVDSVSLDPENRVVALSEYGVLVFFQRYIRHLTRLELAVGELEPSIRPVLTEIELQEEWNRALVPARLAANEAIASALDSEAREFEIFLRTPGRTGSLREDLHHPHQQPAVRRAVLREIARRRDV